MKRTLTLFTGVAALALTTPAGGQGTAFTYQGRLNDGVNAVTGIHDLRFAIYDSANAVSPIAGPLTNSSVAVSEGLFTTTLDFGGGVFNGADRWLGISVRTNGATAFTPLLPRQPVQPTPYAIYSANASVAAAVPAGAITSAMLANGAVTSPKIAPGALSALDAPDGSPRRALFVNTNGAVGIGTNTSGAALQVAGGMNLFSAANPRLLNVITNHSTVVGVSNMTAPVNVFLSGTRAYVTAYAPGALQIFDVTNPLQPRLLGEAVDDSNRPGSPFTRLNGASGIFVTNNIAYVTSENENALTIINVANPQNLVKLAEVTDGVGGFNGLNLPTGVLVSGTNCFVLGFFDSALSILDVSNPSNPRLLKEIFDDSAVPGSPFTKLQWPYQMTLVGTRLYIACRGDSAVTILDVSNPANPQLLGEIVDSTVNSASPFTRLVNVNWVEVAGNVAYVAAGAFNTSLGSLTLVDISNPAAPIKLSELSDDTVQPGSPFTKLRGAWAVKVTRNTAFVTCFGDNALTVIDVADPRNPRLLKELVEGRDGFNHLLFTEGMAIADDKLYVVGDSDNALNMIDFPAQLGLVVDQYVGIGTTTPRSALDVAGVVTTDGLNVKGAVIAGGNGEFANLAARGSVVVDSTGTNNGTRLPGLAFGAGGGEGIASKRTPGAAQSGLDFYTASQRRMHVANNGYVGIGTITPANPLTVLTPAGSYGLEVTDNKVRLATFVGGSTGGGWLGTISNHKLSFYVHDGSASMTVDTNSNVGIGTITPQQRLHVIGNILASGTITPNSDRNAKTDFAPVDTADVLGRVVTMPVHHWRFKTEAPDVKHIGPMAQDFRAAFGLGEIPTAIATVDADGVALAAIQGLNAKLEKTVKEKDARISALENDLAELKKTVKALSARP